MTSKANFKFTIVQFKFELMPILCEFANLTAYADDFLCCEVNFQRDKPSGYRAENLQTHKKARLISI